MTEQKLENITRVEVIEQGSGRKYVNHNALDVSISIQDGGKTLKVFVNYNQGAMDRLGTAGKLQKEVSLAIALEKYKMSSCYEFADDAKKQQMIEDYASRRANMNAAQAAINTITGEANDKVRGG